MGRHAALLSACLPSCLYWSVVSCLHLPPESGQVEHSAWSCAANKIASKVGDNIVKHNHTKLPTAPKGKEDNK